MSTMNKQAHPTKIVFALLTKRTKLHCKIPIPKPCYPENWLRDDNNHVLRPNS